MRKETEQTQPVVERHDDDVLAPGKALTRAHHLDTRAGDHAAAMDPDENGQLILLRLRR